MRAPLPVIASYTNTRLAPLTASVESRSFAEVRSQAGILLCTVHVAEGDLGVASPPPRT
jgi:hypothetical protein